jgi:hypothetical protein
VSSRNHRTVERALHLAALLSFSPLFLVCYGHAAGVNGPLHCWQFKNDSTMLAAALGIEIAGAVAIALPSARARLVAGVRIVLMVALAGLAVRPLGHGEAGSDPWSFPHVADALMPRWAALYVASLFMSFAAIVSTFTAGRRRSRPPAFG